ncbi:MAG: hypothetical protein ABIT96_13940 [Ferruginibacter sp.]
MMDYIYISLIGIVFLLGLFMVKKQSLFSYKLMLVFLLYTFLNESWCWYLKNYAYGNTYALYNIYYYIRFPIIGWMYWYVLSTLGARIVIKIFWILSVFALIVNTFLLYGFHLLHSNYLVAGGVFCILLALMHFYVILTSIKKYNPLQTPFFWISTALFFYFLGILPFFGIINLLLKEDLIFVDTYSIIIKTLSILLYTLIGIDFYVQWKNLKSKL